MNTKDIYRFKNSCSDNHCLISFEYLNAPSMYKTLFQKKITDKNMVKEIIDFSLIYARDLQSLFYTPEAEYLSCFVDINENKSHIKKILENLKKDHIDIMDIWESNESIIENILISFPENK